MVELKELHQLRGCKARHIPYEMTDEGWRENPDNEEEVILLEYFSFLETLTPDCTVRNEGIIFIRPDMTLGRDRIDSFTVIK